MRNATACPICGEILLANDRLVAEWYEPMQWFVLRHYRDVTVDDETVGGIKNFSARTYCGHANHPAVETLTAEWRIVNGDSAERQAHKFNEAQRKV